MRLPPKLHRLYWSFRKTIRYPLAFVWRRLLVNTTVIGITGSVGKTTTKELLHAILSAQCPTVSTDSNMNNSNGAAKVLLSARPTTRYVIIEYGTTRPGSIARIGRFVKPDIGVVLSIAKTHTRSFVTLEDTAAEKSEIFNYMVPNATALINADDPYVCNMAKGFSGDVINFGSKAICDVQYSCAESIWPKRLGLTIKVGDETQTVQTQLVGEHWAGSVAAAFSIAHACGISLADSAKAITKVLPYNARMQPVILPCGAILIRDEYNGTEETFRKMVAVMEKAEAKRLVLIISDVSDRKGNQKRRQMDIGRVAAQCTQLAIFCSDHGHHARKAAIKAGMNSEHCHHVMGLRATSALMQKLLREGDLVFLKGWGTDHLSRLVFAQFGEFGCWSENCRYTVGCDECSELNAQFDLEIMTAKLRQ